MQGLSLQQLEQCAQKELLQQASNGRRPRDDQMLQSLLRQMYKLDAKDGSGVQAALMAAMTKVRVRKNTALHEPVFKE